MPEYSIEFSGSINIQQQAYIEALREGYLAEPQLLELRARFGLNADEMPGDQAQAIVEQALYGLLQSYEGSIGRDIRMTLESRRWSWDRPRGGLISRHEDEPMFNAAVRFSRGSLLFTVVVTIFEAAGPIMAKSALGSLIVAAVEPILVEKVRQICHAGQTITTHVRDVIVRSPLEPAAGDAAKWADDKMKGYHDRLEQLAAKLARARASRMTIAVVMLVAGVVMANFVDVMAMVRQIGRVVGG